MYFRATEGPFAEQPQQHYGNVERDSPMVGPTIVCAVSRQRSSSGYHDPELDLLSDAIFQIDLSSRSRSKSLFGAKDQSPELEFCRIIEVPDVGASTACEVVQNPALESETHQLDPDAIAQPVSDDLASSASASKHRTRFPPLSKKSMEDFEVKPLPTPWKFTAHALYRKSTPGAVKRYTKSDFEDAVTAGFITDDCMGLRWTANGRYLLFRCNEDLPQPDTSSVPSQTPDQITTEEIRPQQVADAQTAQTLFLASPPSLACLTLATGASPSLWSAPYPTLSPETNDILLAKPSLWSRRTLRTSLKPSLTPMPPTDYIPTPLPSPWHFPPNTLYKEAFPSALKTYPERRIESSVSAGIFIADSTGIRFGGSTTYILYCKGARDSNEKFYTPRFEKLPTTTLEEATAGRALELGFEDLRTRPSTPIVEVGAVTPGSPRSVRFASRRVSLEVDGAVGVGNVVDNEGKTEMMGWSKEEEGQERAGEGEADGDGEVVRKWSWRGKSRRFFGRGK